MRPTAGVPATGHVLLALSCGAATGAAAAASRVAVSRTTPALLPPLAGHSVPFRGGWLCRCELSVWLLQRMALLVLATAPVIMWRGERSLPRRRLLSRRLVWRRQSTGRRRALVFVSRASPGLPWLGARCRRWLLWWRWRRYVRAAPRYRSIGGSGCVGGYHVCGWHATLQHCVCGAIWGVIPCCGVQHCGRRCLGLRRG